MLVLAIDTALDACAAAVLDTEANALVACESLSLGRGHAEALMPLIARVMSASQIEFAALDRIAVTTGPGSFTGLRVGLAAARGIGLAANKPVVGLTTLAAFAAPLVADDQQSPILSAIDARHDQVFFQVIGGDGSDIIAARAAPIADVLEEFRDVETLFGAPRIVGNAATLMAQRWRADRPPPVSVAALPAPDIAWIAWLGAAADPAVAVARPTYLRPPDAKPQASLSVAIPPAIPGP